MRCVRCGSDRLARLAIIGQGTSRRYLVGCQACRKVFRSARDPEAADRTARLGNDPFDQIGARLEAEVQRTTVLVGDLLARFEGLGLRRASDLPSPPRISDEDYARAIAAAAR